MKKYLKTWLPFLVVTVLIYTSGCKKALDQIPQTNISDPNFWRTPNDMMIADNYLYSYLPGLNYLTSTYLVPAFQEMYATTAFGQGPNVISDDAWTTPTTSTEYTNYYKLIRAANNVLEKSATVTGDQVTINRYLAEARFFRAFGYFELVKRFGDVPLVLRTLSLTDTLLQAHRTNRGVVVKQIYNDLDYAAANLPQPDQLATAEYGRITATAALAFKSRVALFEGTREKNFNYGNAAADLQIAIDASNAVMTGGKHAVYTYSSNPDSSYHYLFQMQGEGPANKEHILSRIYGQNDANNIQSHSFSSAENNRFIVGTRALVDAYLYQDGLPIGKSAFYQPVQTSTLTETQNRDPRFGMTIFNKNSFYISSNYIPTSSYNLKKWFIANTLINYSYLDFDIIRYAEVLLNNAEAKFELNGAISDAGLNATINLLRNRVKMPPLTNSFVAANGMDMRTEIRRERRIELAFEGFEYWDLLRWKTAEIELPKAILGPKYFQAEMPLVTNPVLDANGFIILEAASKRGFNTERGYLWPIPTNEIALDPNLTQNPGWK